MSKIEVDQITQQSGTTVTVGGGACKTAVVDATTVTLGRSGGSVSLAAGATQSGFGRTGTVDWQTGSIKTGNFTAESGKGYFANTTASAFTMTLPSSPSAGAIVGVRDYANTFSTNNLTIGRGGSNLEGSAGDKTLNQKSQEFLMVYVDGTQGWVAVSSGTGSVGVVPSFISATGGTITCCGNFKIHTFTGPGTFTVNSAGNASGSNTVSYLVLAGAGGGGAANGGGGGGGAGGYRESKAASDSYTASPLNATSGPGYNLPVSAQAYPIVVGGGGGGHPGGTPDGDGTPGNNSSFSSITSAGGGGGSGVLPATADSGGSGGGAGGPGGGVSQAGGVGNTPPVSPAQGQPGGSVAPFPGNNQGAGGGGAGGAGESSQPEGAPGGQPNSFGGNGGLGVTSEITASPVGRAGGGGGNQERADGVGAGKGGFGPQPAPNRNTTPGAGGLGNFGAGNGSFGTDFPTSNTNGTANLGGGGGGVDTPQSGSAGSGGSGIVIIRYKFQ